MLIIELDGKIHQFQKGSDLQREEDIIGIGFKILRFENELVVDDLEIVMSKIFEELFSN